MKYTVYKLHNMRNNIDFIKEKLNQIDNLPTLPAVASQLLEMLGRVDVSMTDISRLMTMDPAITAQILKIVNSAFFGLRKKVDTVKMALVVLGVNEVTNIILSLSLFKTFSMDSSTKFDRKKFWEHSAVVGTLSKYLARRFNVRTHGEEYTAGLLHDIGKIILDQYFHQPYQQVIKHIANSELPPFRAEFDMLGISHMQIGTWLAKQWKIPFQILEVCLFHHNPEMAKKNPKIVALVNLADLYSYKFTVKQEYNNYKPEISSSKSWGILDVEYTDDLNNDLLSEMEKEVEHALEFIHAAVRK